ncbi:MAG: sensor histidine kinase [Akkermansiaceae bacterium]
MRFWSTFLLLAFAFTVPVGALLWMANQASRAEPLALKEQLRLSQAAQLEVIAEKITENLKQLQVPETLSEAQRYHFFAASYLVNGRQFPILTEHEARKNATNGARALKLAINEHNYNQVAALSGLLTLQSEFDYETCQYDESGRNITVDAWRFLVSKQADVWKSSVTDLVNGFPLHLAHTEQIVALAKLLEMETTFLLNSILVFDMAEAANLDTYCQENALARFQLDDVNHLFLAVEKLGNRFAGSKPLQLQLGRQPARSINEVVHHLTVLQQPLTLSITLPNNAEHVQERLITFSIIAALATCFALLSSWILAKKMAKAQELTELKNSLLATVTHELKTPLAASQALLETIENGELNDAEEREYLGLLFRENQRLGQLVDQFLTYSRIERKSLRTETLSIQELLAPVYDWLSLHPSINDEDYKIVTALEIDSSIEVDVTAIQTALINLLDNAIKFSLIPRKVRLCVESHGSEIYFHVENTGKEISKKQQKSIFHPFFQSDHKLSRKHEGVGIGLSIVKSVATAHAGRITLQSTPEKTIFTLMIPMIA